MPRLFLNQTDQGESLNEVFVVANKQIAASNTGKMYIKVMVGDKTAQIPGRMWNAAKTTFERLPDGGFARLKGHIEIYQGNPQFIIEAIEDAVEGTYDVSELLPHTTKNIPEMWARVQELLATIQNRHIAAVVKKFAEDQRLMELFKKAPAAISMHHAFLGGLLEHTLNAMELGNAVVPFYPGISRDLVIAGIFLHDLAKTWELNYEAAFTYSDGGNLVGHVVKIAMWIEHKAQAAAKELNEPIPRPVIDVLQHIALSHHGVPEFGAAKVPSTPEALMVHVLENLDAKMMVAMSLARGEGKVGGGGEGNWSEFSKALGTRIYRPDVSEVKEAPSTPTPAAPTAKPAAVKLNNPAFEIKK